MEHESRFQWSVFFGITLTIVLGAVIYGLTIPAFAAQERTVS